MILNKKERKKEKKKEEKEEKKKRVKRESLQKREVLAERRKERHWSTEEYESM